jgi:hypothetical protein
VLVVDLKCKYFGTLKLYQGSIKKNSKNWGLIKEPSNIQRYTHNGLVKEPNHYNNLANICTGGFVKWPWHIFDCNNFQTLDPISYLPNSSFLNLGTKRFLKIENWKKPNPIGFLNYFSWKLDATIILFF